MKIDDLEVYAPADKPYYSYQQLLCELCQRHVPLIRIERGYWQDKDGNKLHAICRRCITNNGERKVGFPVI